jgi:hypothetical protein
MAVPEKQLAEAQNRMTLKAITKGRVERPHRIALYAPQGAGKSTFASHAPSPIFICTEDGTAHIDTARFPQPKAWGDIMDAVATLTNEKHDYNTLVLDTIDWAEPLCWQKVIADCAPDRSGHRPESIEEVSGGYGKGYQAALDVWRQLIAALERLQAEKGMNVILLAHSTLKTYRNPQGEDFDRFTMRFNDKAAGLFSEWVDELLFANFETFAERDKNKRVRGVSSGARLIYTVRSAAFDAKTRRGIPDQIPLNWDAYARAAEHRSRSLEKLAAEIAEKAKRLGPKMDDVLAALKRAGMDRVKLAQLDVYVDANLGEKESKS